jgi:hypothetical protein
MNATNKGLNAGISARNAVNSAVSTVADKSKVASEATARHGKTAFQLVSGFLTGFIKGEMPAPQRKPRAPRKATKSQPAKKSAKSAKKASE